MTVKLEKLLVEMGVFFSTALKLHSHAALAPWWAFVESHAVSNRHYKMALASTAPN